MEHQQQHQQQHQQHGPRRSFAALHRQSQAAAAELYISDATAHNALDIQADVSTAAAHKAESSSSSSIISAATTAADLLSVPAQDTRSLRKISSKNRETSAVPASLVTESTDPRIKLAKIALLIAAWYATSIGLHVFNTWLFSDKHHGFRFPVLSSLVHSLTQGALAYLLLLSSVRMEPVVSLSASVFIARVLPCAVATSLDIGLSNSSLSRITLSSYTVVKSSSPVFVVLFAYLLGIEKRPTVALILVIFVIMAGVAIMVANDLQFDALGYSEAQAAALFSGLRWSLTQILLSDRSRGRTHPILTIRRLALPISAALFVAFLALEGFGPLLQSAFFASFATALNITAMLVAAGVIAFVVILLEFMVIKESSVLSFSIAGIGKELLTITLSRILFADKFNNNALIGLVISIAGIFAFNVIRQQHHVIPSNALTTTTAAQGPDSLDDVIWLPVSSLADDDGDEEIDMTDIMHKSVATLNMSDP
eukprot:jgi/Hompol1/4561/HPOL_003702-RA